MEQRGVTTDAKVESYNYNPDGGDPGGWTTEDVAFVTREGVAVSATIGHHDPGTESTTRSIRVRYDPLHPDVVEAADYDVAPTDGSEWQVGLGLAGDTSLAALALGAGLFTWKPQDWTPAA